MMDLNPSTPTAGASPHMRASFSISLAGTPQMGLISAGVMPCTWALTLSKSPSRTHSATNFLS